MGASVGAAVGWLLGFEGVAFGVMVLDCAMPVAVFNYMFASRYDRSPSEVASVIVLSTLLSFVTLPILISLLL
jgi:predicted permease